VIPKIIHCCWFGGPKTRLAEKCYRSWRTFAPDWEIREWSTVEGLRDLPGYGFFEKAIVAKKWAFAADWVRFAALYLEGGVYLDYDFELVKSIDALVSGGAFVNAHWLLDGTSGIEAAVIALEKGSPIAKAMLDHYATATFDGRTTVGEILAGILKKQVKDRGEGEPWQLRVLPPEVLSPIDVQGVCHRNGDTVGIHHYAMSWAPAERRVAKWLSWHGLRGVVELCLAIKKRLT